MGLFLCLLVLVVCEMPRLSNWVAQLGSPRVLQQTNQPKKRKYRINDLIFHHISTHILKISNLLINRLFLGVFLTGFLVIVF